MSDDLMFILSCPPHAEVNIEGLAGWFDLSIALTGVRVHCPCPEVWWAGGDPEEAVERLAACETHGAAVTAVAAGAVLALDERFPLRGFEFSSRGLALHAEREEPRVIPADWTVYVVPCRPPDHEPVVRMTMRQAARAANPNKSARQRARSSLSAMRVPVDRSFVDLYFTDGREVVRATMWPGRVSFAGLGEDKRPVEGQNVNVLRSRLAERFEGLVDDRRLDPAPASRITLLGDRTLKGYLEQVHPGMKDVDDYDLLSRLAFLSHDPLEGP